MKHAITLAGAIAVSLWCSSASAQLAYTSKVVNMRAGPAREYPLVAVLPAGLQVDVQGCLADFSWCDVVAGINRGWVYGGNINYAYQNSYQPLPYWGPVVGLAILGFTFDDYWQRHYWNRPWYGERSRWERVQPPPPRQWRPPPHAQAPSGWAPPRAQPPSPGWAPPGQQPSHRPPPPRGQQPPPSGWAPPQAQQPHRPPPSGWSPPHGQQPGVVPAPPPQQRPPGQPNVPPGQAHQRPQPQPPGAAPAPRPPQPGAAPQPRPQPAPRATPQSQREPAPGPRPDNSGRGQPQNP